MRRRSAHPAFTLLELVVVVVVLGLIVAIAIPRVSRGAENAMLRRLHADTIALQTAIDLYAAEHDGRSPAFDPDGNIDTDHGAIAARLTGRTDARGNLTPAGRFGSYLRSVPQNPYTVCPSIRIDGTTTPQDCSWRLDTAKNTVRSDHTNSPLDDLHSGH
ncbi:MAG: prepilin-type N-terminal cleavage/methylation domain-containing protein [Planctomycetota bacterium]|nr:prepilin-type N-terminal cleavage/methylation domain-containing protein [Planctomycetota bacterium]